MSHAEFLRQQDQISREEVVTLVQTLDTAGRHAASLPLEDGVRYVLGRLETLEGLDAGDRAILGFVPRLVLAPRSMRASHLDPLREAGLDDTALHDVVHVVCCFSYMNRLADGLGVGQTELRKAWAIELYGEEAWAKHLAWADSAK